MRRRLFTAMGIAALALVVPSAALADHGRGHHHHHHKAKAHHAKFRTVHIGTGAAATTTTTPSTTTPPTPPTPENAASVTSYTGEVLTLTLNDGSTVSGKVTASTRIGCVKATPTASPTGTEPPTDQSPGEDNSQGDDQNGSETNQKDHGIDETQQGDHRNGGDDNEEVPGTPEPACDSSSLVSGAIVRTAELRIGPAGGEFESVLLVR